MKVYKCSVCGFIFDEAKEGSSFADVQACPLCKAPREKFVEVVEEAAPEPKAVEAKPAAPVLNLQYPADTRKDDAQYRYFKEIHEMAVTGKSVSGAMGTLMPMPNWDDILI